MYGLIDSLSENVVLGNLHARRERREWSIDYKLSCASHIMVGV